MELSEDLKKWRADRPDEWTMDRFIEKAKALETHCDELADFCIWLTGCGYDFCQHDYFVEQRDKLLKNAPRHPEYGGGKIEPPPDTGEQEE